MKRLIIRPLLEFHATMCMFVASLTDRMNIQILNAATAAEHASLLVNVGTHQIIVPPGGAQAEAGEEDEILLPTEIEIAEARALMAKPPPGCPTKLMTRYY